MLLISNIDRWIDQADKHLRGLCQNIDCEKVAEVSETKTSLAYCVDHYIDAQLNRAMWRRLEICREQDANHYCI